MQTENAPERSENDPKMLTFEELQENVALARKTIKRPLEGDLRILNAAGELVAYIREAMRGQWVSHMATGCFLVPRKSETPDQAINDAMEVLEVQGYRVVS